MRLTVAGRQVMDHLFPIPPPSPLQPCALLWTKKQGTSGQVVGMLPKMHETPVLFHLLLLHSLQFELAGVLGEL